MLGIVKDRLSALKIPFEYLDGQTTKRQDCVDRAHRMGQTRPVFAYRLISKDTVEERVMEMQAKKRQLADDLFQGGTGVMKNLTRADLDALLS